MQFKTLTRLFLLLGIIGLISISALAQGETIEIGQATTATTLAPIYTPHDYSVTQQLYTAEEIGTDGTITSIAFHWAYNGSKTYGIDVYMKHTERTYFETTNDRIPLSTSDKVFTGTINPNGDNWVTITLDTPFEYDGSNSLVIAVDRNSGSPGFSEFDNNWNVLSTWYYTSTDRYTMLYNGGSSDVDPFNPPYMTPSNNRPNIQIEISSSTTTCKAPKNFAANNVTNNSATLTWTAGSDDQSNWDVYLTQTSSDVPDENTTPSYQVTENTKALSGLTAQTTYYAYVRAACSATDKSRWVSTNFTTTSEAYHVGANNSYSTNFESSCDWVFTNGDLTNQWWWGSATNNGGTKAMYISNDDGTSNAYTVNKAATVYASKLFTFDQGTYTFTFDWKANGESNYDYLRVALVPGDAEFTASTSTPSVPSGYFYNNLPTSWIALDGGGKLNLKNTWQTQTIELAVSGTYTMVFVWRDDTSTGTQPPAAIDNISIMMIYPKPTNLTANNVDAHSAVLAWTENGSASQWTLQCATDASFTTNLVEISSSFNVNGINISSSVTGLNSGTNYFARVKSVVGSNGSEWTDAITFQTECADLSLPYTYDFESNIQDLSYPMPNCWNRTSVTIQKTTYPYVHESTPSDYYQYAHGEGPNSTSGHYLHFYKTTSTSTETAILPAVDASYDMTQLQIRFWARLYSETYAGKTLEIGIMTSPTASGTFQTISTITVGGDASNAHTNYEEFVVPFSEYTGDGRYIAIRSGSTMGSNVVQILVDDITVELNPSNAITKDITAYTPGSKDRYYLIASPIGTVSPSNVAGMLENNYDLYQFDQNPSDGLEWRNYESNTFDLDECKGYLYANSNDATLKFVGDPYDGDGKVILTKVSGASFEGWNLVGNPFTEEAYISNRTYYRMNPNGTEIVAATAGTPIDAMEGIFVIASENNEKLTFSTTAPSKGKSIVMNLNRATRGGVPTGSTTATIDRAIVRFDEGGQLPKFQLNPSSTKLYISQGNDDYAVVRGEGNGELPVNFKAEHNGTYTLCIETEGIEMNYLHLVDHMTGADINLLENPNYTFEAKTSDYAARFKLVFVCGDANDDNETFAYISNGNIIVNNVGNATVQVIDVTGRILSSESINGNASLNINAAPGIYMLRLVSGNNVKVQKIIIK